MNCGISIAQNGSFHFKHESLQIFPFGMIDVHGVVCRLMELMKNAHMTPAHCGSREDREAELIFVHRLRAAEGEEDAPFFYFLESDGVQTGVAFDGISHRIFVFGERRWVKDDEVVGVLRFFQELEGVFGETLMTRVVGEVEVHVSLREFNGFGGSIDAMNECCSASECIDAEAAGIAEHVENMTSLGIVFQKFTVFTLVHEETCLLSRQPIDLEV